MATVTSRMGTGQRTMAVPMRLQPRVLGDLAGEVMVEVTDLDPRLEQLKDILR